MNENEIGKAVGLKIHPNPFLKYIGTRNLSQPVDLFKKFFLFVDQRQRNEIMSAHDVRGIRNDHIMSGSMYILRKLRCQQVG